MRKLCVVLFVTAIAVVTHAQTGSCGLNLNIIEVQCGNSICQDEYPITWTTPCSEDGPCEFYSPTTTNCCGIEHTYLSDSGNICFISELRDSQVRSRLLLLAEKDDILVPNCKGAYLPLENLSRMAGEPWPSTRKPYRVRMGWKDLM
jgi:hypothetical protein